MRVLIVDDNAESRAAWSLLLAAKGLTAAAAGSAAAARRDLYSAGPPAGLLLDYYLPDGDGLSFLREIRASGLATPAVILTAAAAEVVADVTHALAALGPAAVFQKPADPEAVIAALGLLRPAPK